ncbi:tRNA threonylcarbamoyladenosine biosynthesis protein TsaB [Flavobacteriaceae bacterium UJ101]|nr:tRNA threonylcarbamoyladenosine biosynthesis protein TsaB [Flavobacteriaceae bacterium UJ101]
MALILHIETATKNCSVALAKDGIILDSIDEYSEQYSHAERLHVFIEQLFENSIYTLQDLDAIAVGKGPGSYTGLRIGVSSAKGLCFGLKIPLISIDTLTILANSQKTTEFDYLIPMIDARRMEVYTAIFNPDLSFQKEIHALIVEENSFERYTDKKILCFGNGASKCKEIIHDKNFTYLDHCHPSAKDMVNLSFDKFQKKEFEDVAYFEPFYLKDFVALKSKKSLF